jgi:hypothetical protein
MPIRREFRKYYLREWRDYRAALIAIHGPVCASCRMQVTAYLNLCHITHDPRSSAVRLMCAACHNRHDSARRIAVFRRNRARAAGQLWLLDEIEFAASPSWLIPRRVLAAAQQPLALVEVAP